MPGTSCRAGYWKVSKNAGVNVCTAAISRPALSILLTATLFAGQRPSPIDAQVVELEVRHVSLDERPCSLLHKVLRQPDGKRSENCTLLVDLFAVAFSVDRYHVFAPQWVYQETYEVYVEMPDRIRAWPPLLRQILLEKLEADVTLERSPGRVLVLKTPNGEPKLPLSRATECTNSKDTFAGAISRTDTPSDIPTGGEKSVFRGCTLKDVARTLEFVFGMKVQDETTAKGRYDFALDLQGPAFANGVPIYLRTHSNENSLPYVAQSIRQVLGAELQDTSRLNDRLVIHKLRKIRGSVRYKRPK